MQEQIGFIGIGDQGGPIARRIAEGGYDLTLWARRPAALDAFADTAARAAPTIAALGAACDIVGVCVFADADVAEVVGQLLQTMRAGSIILIHSTAHPDLCARLARDGAARDVAVLDAPVSGGNARAAAGQLAVMIGGDRDACDRLQPLLATFATTVAWLGAPGSGQVCKLLNNALFTINSGTALAVLEAGDRLGLDRAALVRMLSTGSGQSLGLEMMARATPASLKFAFERLEKDVALALDVLQSRGLGDSRAAKSARLGVAGFEAFAAEAQDGA
ncbi:MAG: NAD(P)-dependent oxidoreductase [Alphaproteobacteria bacterium]|nr:NAD(P)-dependent oxidoreductase [Alphaproteobacteria bacterium]